MTTTDTTDASSAEPARSDHPPISMVVLGTGRIGAMHAEILARRVLGTRLIGVFDVFAPSAQAVADDLGVPAFATLEAALASECDAVCIATSTDTHVSVMKAAAAAGKHIFCEKPISLDVATVDDGLAAVAAAGVHLHIGFNRRFDPSHKSVADAVAAGRVGDPHLIKITSRDPAPPPIEYIRVSGGLFNDMTIHDFDMARYVARSEVVEVYAAGGVMVDAAIGDAGDIDTAAITLKHASGAITQIDNSRRATYGYDQRVEVFGSEGMVASANPTETTTRLWTDLGSSGSVVPHFFIERYTRSYLDQWSAFATALQTGSPPPVSGADGRAPLVMAMAALRSLEENRPVRIDEIDS